MYLLAKNGYDVDKAKICWNFVNDSKEEPASNRLCDGIYLIGSDGTAVLFEGKLTEAPQSTEYIGVVQGDRSVAVALTDMAGGDDVTLTDSDDKTGDSQYYIGNYEEAVQDYDGETNTQHLRKIGLNPQIKLKDGEYIPSLGELYIICLNQYAINEALKFVGGQPLAKDWYWSSTEYSATCAWSLDLYRGSAGYYYTKATHKGRVRAVSAFLR
jgi:hypothetical protein